MTASPREDPASSAGRKKPRLATFLLGFSMFATGACGLVFEYILSTVSTYILGNSIEQFSITIASMLFMMGVAGYVQKFMTDSALIEKFIFLEIALALLGGFAPIVIYAAFGLTPDHFLFVNYFFVAAIGFLIGFEIPLVMRINEKYSETLGANIAGVVSPDYLGAFLGALVWTYFLLKVFPLTEISFLVGGTNFFIAAVTFLYFMKHGLVRHRAASVAAIVLAAVLLAYGFTHNRGWNRSLEQKLYDSKIVLAETTKYQRLVMTHDRELDEYRFYINGNLQFSSLDEKIYHEQLVLPAMSLAQSREKTLILGGGDGLALREVLKHRGVKSATLVDLDPDMTELCSSNPILARLNNGSLKDARVHAKASAAVYGSGFAKIYQETGKTDTNGTARVERVAGVEVFNLDADKFIKEVNGAYDVIIIDFPDPNSIELAKLYSREFYLKLFNVLEDRGIAAVQATSPYHAKESFLCILRTMASAGFQVLPYHDNVPSFGDWGWILAWKPGTGESEMKRRISSLKSFEVDTGYLTPDLFRASMVFGKNSLASQHESINTLMHPVLLTYYLDESWKAE